MDEIVVLSPCLLGFKEALAPFVFTALLLKGAVR